jgi:hypothetical protein
VTTLSWQRRRATGRGSDMVVAFLLLVGGLGPGARAQPAMLAASAPVPAAAQLSVMLGFRSGARSALFTLEAHLTLSASGVVTVTAVDVRSVNSPTTIDIAVAPWGVVNVDLTNLRQMYSPSLAALPVQAQLDNDMWVFSASVPMVRAGLATYAGAGAQCSTLAPSPCSASWALASAPALPGLVEGRVPVSGSGSGSISIDLTAPFAADAPASDMLRIAGAWPVLFTSQMPTCPADFNQDGLISPDDIFAFLTEWFVGGPRADVAPPAGIDVQDIFAYLATWFVGCP